MQMSKDKKFKNESQDARRHDQQRVSHPNEKINPHHEHFKKKKNNSI